MAGTLISDYTPITDDNIVTFADTLDNTFYTRSICALTEEHTTIVPQIKAGSVMEVNGDLYVFYSNESISTIDPFTSSTVADGAVYIISQVSGSSITASFTATAPTWSDSKQGWYGTGGQANNRYFPFTVLKSGSDYYFKQHCFYDRAGIRFIAAQDLTERSIAAGAGYVTEPNLILSFPVNNGEIWQIYFRLEGYHEGVGGGSAVTIKQTAGSSPYAVLGDGSIDSTGRSNMTINNSSTYRPFAIQAKVYGTSSETVSFQMEWLAPSLGANYAKNRKFFAVKVRG